MNLTVSGILLIFFGGMYLKNQTIYRRGIWLKTSLAIRLLSEENYKKYMKILGLVFIVLGLALVALDQGHKLGLIGS